MIVKILDVERQILVNTVTLSHNHTQPDNIFLFRCMWCNSAISQVQGTIASIVPGLIPTQDVSVLNKCPKCSEVYTFQSSDAKPGPTRLKLAYGHLNLSCVICRTHLIAMKTMTNPFLVFPVAVNCPMCPMRYSIVDVL